MLIKQVINIEKKKQNKNKKKKQKKLMPAVHGKESDSSSSMTHNTYEHCLILSLM